MPELICGLDMTSIARWGISCILCFPLTTAKVERVFSTMEVIKTERRTNLNCSTLNDLLEVSVEGQLSVTSP